MVKSNKEEKRKRKKIVEEGGSIKRIPSMGRRIVPRLRRDRPPPHRHAFGPGFVPRGSHGFTRRTDPATYILPHIFSPQKIDKIHLEFVHVTSIDSFLRKSIPYLNARDRDKGTTVVMSREFRRYGGIMTPCYFILCEVKHGAEVKRTKRFVYFKNSDELVPKAAGFQRVDAESG